MSEKTVAAIRAREAARKPLPVVETKAQKAKLDAVREAVEKNREAVKAAPVVEPTAEKAPEESWAPS